MQNLRGMPDTRPKIQSFNEGCPIQSTLICQLGVRSFYVHVDRKYYLASSSSNFQGSSTASAMMTEAGL